MNNIVFETVDIKGFLSIGDVKVDLSEQGFTMVKGINNESAIPQSNGSGKSAIFDAIFYALTGETIRGSSEVVNEHLDTGCSVELNFSDQNHSYKINRYRNHSTLGTGCDFSIDGDVVSTQIKKSQEEIIKVLPLVSDPEVLGSIVLLGQGLPYKFSSFSPSKRKEILEVMSGSSSEIDKVKYKLDVLESSHNSELNSINSDISTLKGTIVGYESSINLLNNQIDSYKSPEEITSEINELESKVVSNDELSNMINNSLSDLREKLSKSQNESLELNNKLNNYSNSLNLIKGQLSSMKVGNCPTCGRPYEVTEETESQKLILEDKISKLSSIIQELSNKISSNKNDQSETNNEIGRLNNDLSTLNFNNYQIKNQISNLKTKNSEIESLKSQLNEVNHKIVESKVLINDKEKESDRITEICDCIGYLKRQLSRDFKGYVLEEVIKYMSSRAEYYSQYFFTNGSKVEISLSGSKILIKVGGRLYENLSGGERQRVDLAVQFSLRDMLMTTSGFSCNLLVLDEAFDNLDSQGSDALIKLIISEFTDIDSVFVVTHHSEIDIPYDNQILVVKESDGISYVR